MIELTLPCIADSRYYLNDFLNKETYFDHITKWGSVRIKAVSVADIRLFTIEFNTDEERSVVLEINALSLVLSFTLSGQYKLVSDNQMLHAESTHQGGISTGYQKLSMRLNGALKIFIVCFLENGLERSPVTELLGNEFTLLQSVRPTTTQMNQVIGSIMDNMGKKGRHHIYAEAKALELLCLELEQLETLTGQQRNQLWKEQDHERINKAKTIIEGNLQNPCSLIELAHKVGLNDFKLKKGFREVLGTTVFGYLNDLRMKKADTLLKEGKLVKDVAYEVGYKNAHHFTVAFKKKFGYLPSKVSNFLGLCFFCISIY